MLKRELLFMALACVGVTATGCASRMATVSNEKSAYAVRATLFGSEMLYCSAENPQQPVCRSVTEK